GEAFRKDKSLITGSELDLQVPMTEVELEKNEKGKFLIGVEVPKDAEKGTYIFNVVVDYEGNPSAEPPIPDKRPYDNPLQFIVKVP
ncbi:MAG: hypothetical protein KKD17_03515, partial [Nanoarchaeota archaeon]|nr:hypothetical protein [Nanoarchaeota archaeon]